MAVGCGSGVRQSCGCGVVLVNTVMTYIDRILGSLTKALSVIDCSWLNDKSLDNEDGRG